MRVGITYILSLFIVLAALLMSGGCTKEPVATGGADEIASGEGDRVITLSFGTSTKSFLDGLTPKFRNGDRIMLSNGQSREVREVKVSGSTASVSTSLKGELKAVYPSTAASLNGNAITGIKVPAIQSGRFADANIAMATIPEDDATATFEPKTAILKFYVDKSIGVKSITITAGAGNIADDSNTVIVNPEGNTTIDRCTDDAERRICYVSVRSGVTASDLTFTSVTTTQGTVTRAETSTTTFAEGHIFKAFIPYYIDFGPGGKWAYCNIGAFLPEDKGQYFAWGETGGREAATSGAGAFAAKPFVWANAPFNNGAANMDPDYFTAQKPTVCPGGVLAPQYDAATVNWGGHWRMPTGGALSTADFTILANACKPGGYSSDSFVPSAASNVPNAKGVYFYSGADGQKGLYMVDDNGNKLFFPSAGISGGDDGSKLDYPGNGYYWSASLYNDEFGYRMNFASTIVNPQDPNYKRYGGLSIRPVFTSVPYGALSGNFSVSESRKVYFSKGNLYWDGAAYRFENEQYHYRHYHGKDGDMAVPGDSDGKTPEGTVGSLWWVDKDDTEIHPYDEIYPFDPYDSDDYFSAEDIIFTNATPTTANANFTVSGVKGMYRTLSPDEWSFLFNLDGADNVRKGRWKGDVTVCGVLRCTVVAPDDWNLTANPLQEEYSATSSPMTWEQAQSLGLVCLVPAGVSDDSGVWEVEDVDPDVMFDMKKGRYWASSPEQDFPELVGSLTVVRTEASYFPLYRDMATAIRLVVDL